ncbi:hypothetical protein [Metallosphaera hakonensis]|uniref:hypothetical protein n=1 Tax=Metallosphaera hakonensis TaxID=79601 RepID=UPI000AF550E3|nr:hypothetical protein [Metallosphaera hakonensis]
MEDLKELIEEVLEYAEEEIGNLEESKVRSIFEEFTRSEFFLKSYTDSQNVSMDFVVWYALIRRDPETDMTLAEKLLQNRGKDVMDKIRNVKIITGTFSIRDAQKNKR